MSVGIIGTGLLGKAVATRLLKTGHEVMVYNRSKEKTELLRTLGAKVANTPKEVAKSCDIVITIVKNADAVEAVSFGKDGIVSGYHDGLAVADMSTINPASSKNIAKKFSENNIPMIDVPVMGGPGLAEKGELVIMIGGKKEVYERHKKIFDDIGNKTFYLGDNGAGVSMKLAMNLQISILAISLSEGILLARKAGLDPVKFLEVLNSTYFRTGMSVNKGPKMISNSFEPSFTLSMMKKDLDIINDSAKGLEVYLPMATLAGEIYQSAQENGFGEIDYTGILAFLEKIGHLH